MKSEFTKWFNSKKFRNFTALEFTSYFEVTRRGVTNSYPLKPQWENIVPTLRIVDDLRDQLNSPIVLLSSYRNREYNQKCGGVIDSQHRFFRALDIAAAEHSPQTVYNILLERRREGKWTGGLGLYPTFVHIDTRGYNTNW